MSENESFRAFMRSLNERYEQFKVNYLEMLASFLSSHFESKMIEVKKTLRSVIDLRSMLSVGDSPRWLLDIHAALLSIESNAGSKEILRHSYYSLLNAYSAALSQTWSFGKESNSTSVDFEEIYKRCYSQSKLPELFQEMVSKLQEIADSGQVDSLRFLKSLEKLIATLKKNLNGSYFAVIQSKAFLGAFLKNTGVSLLSSVPVLGNIVEGLSRTFNDMNSEFVSVQSHVEEELANATSMNIPMPQIESRERLALPAPTSSKS